MVLAVSRFPFGLFGSTSKCVIMSLENEATPQVEEVAAVSAEPAAAPSYVDAFPSLPMGTVKARPSGRSFAAASGAAVRSTRVTEVRWQCS
jgi:hypothetical protein